MNVSSYNNLINKPGEINEEQTLALEKVVDEFPFFQSARALRLKGLYIQNSYKYNFALKVVAAHTTDRTVLFDFITSESFSTVPKKTDEKETIQPDNEILNTPLALPETKEEPINILEQSILTSIKEATPIIEESPNEESTKHNDEKSEDEKTVNFSKNETHSFQQWLQLSRLQPIIRPDETPMKEKLSSNEMKTEVYSGNSLSLVPDDHKKISEETVIKEHSISPEKEHSGNIQNNNSYLNNPQEETNTSTKTAIVDEGKQKKAALIDQFIKTNPKIPPIKPGESTPPPNLEMNTEGNPYLMTETLARIYLEQKKYVKAIQAYEILILKYPEKSSYFASRINDIKTQQNNNQ